MTLEMKPILVAVASVQLLLSPAEGQIKVFRLTTASQIIEDVTNDAALVSIDNSLRRVVLTADSAAMDYFIHQVDPTESIDSINFSAAPTVAGNTIYRVSVSADHSWSSDVFEPVAIGAASLNSFIGFGEAAPDTNPNAPSYYVKLRVGVTGDLGSIITNEVVRVDADRVGSSTGGFDWTIYGPVRYVSAGEVNLQLLTIATTPFLSGQVRSNPPLFVPWPYNASETERLERSNVGTITTQELIHTSERTTGDITIVATAQSIPGSIDQILARERVLAKVWAWRRINVVEGWRGIEASIRAGLGGDRLQAGKLDSLGSVESGGDIFTFTGSSYIHDFSNEGGPIAGPDDGKLRLVRAVKADQETGEFRGELTIKSLELTPSFQDEIRFDADLSGRLVLTEGLPANKLLIVGGSHSGSLLFGNQATAVPAPIAGQVIVNQAADGGIVAGSAQYNTNLFTDLPFYAATSQSIGGGAIGLAPFALHVEDSIPKATGAPAEVRLWQFAKQSWARAFAATRANNLDSLNTSSDEGFIRARFYGPVKRGASTNQLLRFERLNANDTWTDVSDDGLFTSALASTAPLNRDIRIGIDSAALAPDTYCATTYRITPNNLVCNLVAGQPPVAAFEYQFVVLPELSPADIGGAGGAVGGDGVHDNNDFVVFIQQFFDQTLLADFGGEGAALGPDGALDNNDFVTFIQLYFEAPIALFQTCDASDATPVVPFELPDALQTADAQTDRQLNALWIAMTRTNDPRVAARLVETLFDGAQ